MQKLKFLTILIILIMSLSLAGPSFNVYAAPLMLATNVSLGTAGTFVVLAGTPNITDIPNSVITGDVGLDPASGAAIGIKCSEMAGGTIYDNDGLYTGAGGGSTACRVTNAGLLTLAKNDLITAYNALSAGPNAGCDTNYGAVTQELSGLSLIPGIYCANAFQLSGPLPLTLDDTGAPNGIWIFKTILSTLNTTPGGVASVVFKTGVGSSCNVWWKVLSSATIGSGTSFIGNILALTTITMGTNATLDGRALARNGQVTLDHNTISAPVCNFGLSKAFSPSTIVVGSNSTLTLTYTNTNVNDIFLSAAVTDNLPGGVVIATIPAASTTCGGTGALVATAGTSTVTLPVGRIIPGSGSCTLTVDVTGTSVGTHANLIVANGAWHGPATAPLAVLPVTKPPTLPGTGFAPGVKTILSKQPADKTYASLGDLWLEIPHLGVQIPIVGVPVTANGWDVTWLSDQAGWLQGTAFPTWAGNSVLTAHVYDVNGNLGPFGHLSSLVYGNQIIVHAWGQQYVYEVRSMSTVTPKSISSVMRHEELPWLTLMTCKGYVEKTNSYSYRYLVRAVQVKIK